MIHRAKDLSPDQKLVIESLLGRWVGEDEAISIRTLAPASAPEWLHLPGKRQNGRDCAGSLLQRSMRRSIWRGRRGVVVSIPRSNDPRCPRHQHLIFCPAESARTTRTSVSANP